MITRSLFDYSKKFTGNSIALLLCYLQHSKIHMPIIISKKNNSKAAAIYCKSMNLIGSPNGANLGMEKKEFFLVSDAKIRE